MSDSWSFTANRHYRQGGFTLIEILLALMLFGLIFSAVFQLLDTVVTAETSSRDDYRYQSEDDLAWAIIRQDLISIRRRATLNRFGDLEPAFYLQGGRTLKFVRAVPVQSASITDIRLQRVEYEFTSGKLVRRSWDVLDLDEESDISEQILLVDLADFSILVVGKDREARLDWPQLSNGQSNAEPDQTMPNLIEVRVTRSPSGESEVRLFPGLS